MFVSHDRSPSKKTFQKPNILRRKTKITSIRALPSKPTPVPSQVVDGNPSEASTDEKAEVSHKPEQRVQLELCVARDVAAPGGGTDEVRHAAVIEEGASTDGVDCDKYREAVDVEAFLNGGQLTQYRAEYEIDIKLEKHSLHKRHIAFGNAAEKIKIETSEGLQVSTEGRAAASAASDAHVALDHFIIRPAKFKCDEPDCNKQFLTEQKLRRHRSVHNKHARPPRTTSVECPVRLERPCGLVFPARELLARHLREDHAPDDAPHRCGECGRRFFWQVGLRAHVRAHGGARPPLACAWPGCGRAFRQPCRLREHARAHTGDKPYPCRHPGCGWAFRTASKLLRHARRHTGERRHACACGRAFRRREHLRDHQARPTRAPGCGQSFGSALHGHWKAHGHDAAAPPASADPDADGMFMVQLLAEGEGGEGSEGGGGATSARCARTHLTWPLAPPADSAPEELELCAVRSDLFLPAGAAHTDLFLPASAAHTDLFLPAGAAHTDLFLPAGAAHTDDSQQMSSPGVQSGPASPAASPPHAGLGLLDLMQEELMYTDAVDESSFQVLLLSEELG